MSRDFSPDTMRDVAAGEAEGVREEGDEGVVRGAVDRRRREADENGAAPHAVDTGARRARDHADIENGDGNCELQTAN